MSNKYPHSYILTLSFLGFRYHGWQKQEGVKTVQKMLERTINFIIDQDFKTLGAGRTDKMVSALDYKCELFTTTALPDDFLTLLKQNLPKDIRALGLKKKTTDFNIIQDIQAKEYRYYFTQKILEHPFLSPYITEVSKELDFDLIEHGLKAFEGNNNYTSFSKSKAPLDENKRQILSAKLLKNQNLPWGIEFDFPVYCFQFISKGFMRYQVRFMTQALFALGEQKINLTEIQNQLKNPTHRLTKKAPASGLVLYKTSLCE